MRLKDYKFECWHVAFRFHKEDVKTNKESFCVIHNTWRYWAADPFIIEKDGYYFIFAELYDKLLTRGKIGVSIIDSNGKIIKKWKPIIDNKLHLSFPNVSFDNGVFYMMPETNREDNLCIFSSVHFPYMWKKEKELFRGKRIADSVFLNDELILSYDNFSKPYHALVLCNTDGRWDVNFCVEDTKLVLRPGGKVISSNGDNYLVPLQNCDGEYGKSLLFSWVTISKSEKTIKTRVDYELNSSSIKLNDFHETIYGIHTYNSCGDFEVIDLKTYEFSWARLLGHIKRKLKGRKEKRADIPKYKE